MFNIRACNENGQTLRLIWSITEGTKLDLHSRWLIQDSPDIVKGFRRGLSEDRNQPVTNACDTGTIAACA